MQKQPSISVTQEEISDIQHDPVIQKLFEDAIEVLRLAGADDREKATATGKTISLKLVIDLLILLTMCHTFI